MTIIIKFPNAQSILIQLQLQLIVIKLSSQMSSKSRKYHTAKSFYERSQTYQKKKIFSKSFQNKSMGIKTEDQSKIISFKEQYKTISKIKQVEGKYPPEVYFNNQIKKKYFCDVIDSFLCKNKSQKTKIDSHRLHKAKRYYTKPTIQYPEMDSISNQSENQEKINDYLIAYKPKKHSDQKMFQDLESISEFIMKKRSTRSAVRTSISRLSRPHSSDNQNLSARIKTDQLKLNSQKMDKKIDIHSWKEIYKSSIKNIQSEEQIDGTHQNSLISNYHKLQQNCAYHLGYANKGVNKVQIKQFKNSILGQQLKKKTNTILSDFHIPKVWKQSEMKDNDYYYTKFENLRQRLFSLNRSPKFIQTQKTDSNKFQLITVIPRSNHMKLFQNNHEEIKDLISSLIRTLQLIRGKVICLEISLDNIYYIEEKDYRIGNWGSSIIKKQFKLKTEKIGYYQNPTIQDQSGNWLIHPQYIPPQILTMIIQGKFQKQTLDTMYPEVWSIGLLLYQIYVMIPVWMPNQIQCGHKLPKKGILFDKNRSLEGILVMQQKLGFHINHWLRNNKKSFSKEDQTLLNLMKQMLDIDHTKRPSFSEILQKLKQ